LRVPAGGPVVAEHDGLYDACGDLMGKQGKTRTAGEAAPNPAPYVASGESDVPRMDGVQPSRFSFRQPPALLFPMICLNIAVSADALMVSS
jgi:hypothetical protein